MALFKDFEQIIDEQEKKTNKLFIDENNSNESIKSTFFEPYLSQGICKVQKLSEFYLRYQYFSK